MEIDEALARMIRATKRSRTNSPELSQQIFNGLILTTPEEVEALELLLNCSTYDMVTNPVLSGMQRLLRDLSDYVPYGTATSVHLTRTTRAWVLERDTYEFVVLYNRLKNYLDAEMPTEGGRYRYVVRVGEKE